jgi:zinc protease
MKLRLLLSLVFGFAALSLLSQGTKFDPKATPPLDPKIRTGVLDNGMHYYIRANKFPEKRAEFYIAHNVGAILEDDDQNGLAHFTEHMAFNGTTNYPKKALLDYLATIGVKFGTNVNASTGLEQTVYNVSNVPLKREGILDSCLLILHDWSNYISFEPEEVELERGVIREEWRMYGTASERMDNKLSPIVYKGSKYAIRNVIGDTAVINHFKRETIVRFYHKWYRPDLQAIIVVGDFDADAVEAKIKKLFAEIPKAVNPAAKETYPVPDNKEPLIGTATDKEATGTVVSVMFKFDAVPDNMKNVGYMRTQLVRNLVNSMLRQRLSELSRTEKPPFINAMFFYRQFTRTKDAFSGMAQCANNESIKALTALLTEAERMKRYGFGAGELERTKADMLRNTESRYMERDKRKNRELVRPIVSYFLTNSPNAGPDYDYEFTKAMLPGITLEEINAEAKKFVRDDNEIITVTGPEKEGVTMPSVDDIKKVLATYKNAKIEPYADMLVGAKLMSKEPVPGKIVKTTTNATFGTTEWTLSNGVTVILKPTDIREDELTIQGLAQGGTSHLTADQLVSGDFAGDVAYQMGLGNFSRTDLDKILSGKKVSLNLGATDDQNIVSVRTSPKDMETAFQMIYLTFTSPRWNETEYNTWLEKTKAGLANASSEPRKAFADTIQVMVSGNNPRVKPMTPERLKEVSLEKIKNIYGSFFNNAGKYTFIFVGTVNPELAKPLVEKYLASLPGSPVTVYYKDNGVRTPMGKTTNKFSHEMRTPRTSIYASYHGLCEYTPENRVLGAALRHILELKYIQKIREDEGGAYSIRIAFNLPKYPLPYFRLTTQFETDPAKADKLLGIVYLEAQKMADHGPDEADLAKAKEYFLKQRAEDMKENTWWLNTLTDFYFYDMDYLTGYEAKVNALTPNAVKDFAFKLVSQQNVVEVVMKPSN